MDGEGKVAAPEPEPEPGALGEWIRGLPKAEVHVHLEGCVPASLVGLDDPHVSSLADLLSYLDGSCARVVSGEQVERLAYEIARRANESGVMHADVIFNPTHWSAWRGELATFVAHLDAGFSAGEDEHGVSAALCLSLRRTEPHDASVELVDWLLDTRPRRVVALSVDGDEARSGRTSPRLAPLFARAAAAGLHRVAHAGESSGPDGVRDAIDLLGAERVDHGIRAVEDPSLVAELATRAVPLDVCPTSNVALGVVASMEEHPIEKLRASGVRVSVNTDDPLVLGTTVAFEYEACARTFGWGREVLGELARTSIESSFAIPERRSDMLAALDAYLVASGPT